MLYFDRGWLAHQHAAIVRDRKLGGASGRDLKCGDQESMGKLLVMPVRSTAQKTNRAESPFDLSLWLSAPGERNPAYLAVYGAVALAIQSALRLWVAEWLNEHPEAIERRVSGYSLLAFSCTRPYRGRTINMFTYDVQQTSVVDRALRVASRPIAQEVRRLNQMRVENEKTGQRLVPDKVAEFVRQRRQPIYRMFHVETLLMDEILKFTQMNIPKMGLEPAAVELRSAFERHLRRFTDGFDMSKRAGELLYVATNALRSPDTGEDRMPFAA